MGVERAHLSPGLSHLIDGLGGLAQPDSVRLFELVEAAGIGAAELECWADDNHSPRDSYGRQLVWHGGHFEVMVMTWLPGDFSAIHDHGMAEWGVVQSFGEAEHHTYRLDCLHLCHEVAQPYASGQVRLITPGLIHQMGNAGQQRFLSLHVYGCREPRPAITASARVFELDEGCIQFTNAGVFFGLPESDILRRQAGLTSEPRIHQRQAQLKAWRLQQMGALVA